MNNHSLKKLILILALCFFLQKLPLRAQGTTFGVGTVASGYCSMAFNVYATASGNASTSFGYFTQAIGNDSTAFGAATTASGYNSTAFGSGATASGYGSAASGLCTTASGNYSTASGSYVTAASVDSFTVGLANIGGGDPVNWVGTDPLFEVGNGTYTYINPEEQIVVPSDAFIVYKNGNSIVGGNLSISGSSNAVLVPPAGNLSMGAFTYGPHPQHF